MNSRNSLKLIVASASLAALNPAPAPTCIPPPLVESGPPSQGFFDMDASKPFKELVFSGVQPTGNLHLGNYLGAIVRFVEMQKTHECIYCVVDMHAITVWQDPKELNKAIREVTAAFIACGIDPKTHIVFNQSQVAEHAELAWVFNCVARMGWLNRMTQFKEKAGKDRENVSVGLYDYPVLMAADILVYRATHVPVGEDQKQHVELTRDIAQKFNNDFAESIAAHGFNDGYFPLPEPVITGPARETIPPSPFTTSAGSTRAPASYSRYSTPICAGSMSNMDWCWKLTVSCSSCTTTIS